MSRPLFVPSGKRRTKQQRFHGAFTGGFSAGYFNSVDTKEGWAPKPSNESHEHADDKSLSRKPQKMEDFMDEQDFNEWGGPTSVKQDFSETKLRPPPAASLFSIDPPLNVGKRLLRMLGWRDGDTAYVPASHEANNEKSSNDHIAAHLSDRKLKRIQLQQTLVKLPMPKLDTCGLGYDAFLEAPEFKKHREQLRRKAQERIKAVTNKTGSNVYRLSDLTSERGETPADDLDEDNDYDVSHEMMQDFVGTKSVGGFALREDDDDVYDAAPLPKDESAFKIDKEHYDVEIYDPISDEEESSTKANYDVGGIFSSWAETSNAVGAEKGGGLTSDGRQVLPGFVLGGACSRSTQQRYPGPDIPHNFELKRHVFSDNECPETFRSESVVDRIIHKVQQATKKKREEKPIGAMAGSTFVGLAEAMKNRFSTQTSVEEKAAHPAGLHVPFSHPESESKEPIMEPVRKEARKEIKLTRTTMLFIPDPLLCKRLNVKPPSHSKSTKLETKQGAEASFFEKHVMVHAVGAPKPVFARKDEHEEMMEPAESRPDRKVYQSIFQPESDSSDSDESNVVAERPPFDSESTILPPLPTGVPRPSELIHSDPFQYIAVGSMLAKTSPSEVLESKSDKMKQSKKSRKQNRRSSDYSFSDASTDSDDRRHRRKERKRRKKEKKMKKVY